MKEKSSEADVVVDVDRAGSLGATVASWATPQDSMKEKSSEADVVVDVDRAGSLDLPCGPSVTGNSSGGDVEKNVFECCGERALLLLAARHGRNGGATMCKHTDQRERSERKVDVTMVANEN